MSFFWFMVLVFLFVSWRLSVELDIPDAKTDEINSLDEKVIIIRRRVSQNVYLDLFGFVLVLSVMFESYFRIAFLFIIVYAVLARLIDHFTSTETDDGSVWLNREYIDERIKEIRAKEEGRDIEYRTGTKQLKKQMINR